MVGPQETSPPVATVDPVDPFKDQETWENVSAGRVNLKKLFGAYGQTSEVSLVHGQRVRLTPAERRMNEDAVVRPDYNPFRNGQLRPLRLIETEADYEELRSSPNVMSDGDIKELLKGRVETVQKRLAQVTNLTTLKRIQEIANELDVPTSKSRAVTDRIAEVDPLTAHGRVRIGGPTPGSPELGPQAVDPLRDGPMPVSTDIYDDRNFQDGITVGH